MKLKMFSCLSIFCFKKLKSSIYKFNDKRFTISKMINVMVSSLDEIFVKKCSPFLLKGTGLFIESKTNLLYKLIYNGLEI